MLRLVFFGVAFSLATASGPRPASAEPSENAAGAAGADQGDEAGEVSGESAESAPTKSSRKRHRGGKRSRRHDLISGRVVPEEKLRQDPLPRPSGKLDV